MKRFLRCAIAAVGPVIVLAFGGLELGAHKPITSKYTYNEHVFPIFRDRCAGCHVDGGVAPMSLMTYADAYPWAESIRAELVAGRMPPWPAEEGAIALRHQPILTPRELDTVLTWATGGTPEGPPERRPATVSLRNEWSLGEPDVVLEIPEPVTLASGQMEMTRRFVVAADALRGRHLAAVDLLPGTPAIVRRASIVARPKAPTLDASVNERLLALWLPGGDSVRVPDGTAFEMPSDVDLVATITYRKTWKYENSSVSDRSRIGVYFARTTSPEPIAVVDLNRGTPEVSAAVRAVAVRIDSSAANDEIGVDAVLPTGSRLRLLTAAPAAEWPRRFWFERPVPLPAGTRFEVTAAGDHRPNVIVDIARAH